MEEKNKTLSEYLEEIFDECNIKAKYDVREDISYYNESEPDIDKLKQAKIEGISEKEIAEKYCDNVIFEKMKGEI